MSITSFSGKYNFLSNFYVLKEPIIYDGFAFPSVEHGFQCSKMKYNADKIQFTLTSVSPAKAKRLGRQCPMRDDWDKIKIDVMRDLLRIKFHNKIMASLLLSTGDEKLVEGNWWGDTFWGVCNGVGENWLGKLLMEVREEIRKTL